MEVIGQFGEGLKVGALALVRDGRIVTMETGNEHWRFELIQDEDFGVKVLSVHVTGYIFFSSGYLYNINIFMGIHLNFQLYMHVVFVFYNK